MAEEDIEKVHPYRGQIITGQIDISRRMALTRNHTATHLIVAAARKILGDHIWQAGAQKGVKKSRIDLTHYKRIEPEELQEIELLANKFVMENRPVLTNWMARAEAEKKYGFILYQGGIVPGMDIRTVLVDGIDVQACAGTHCNQTGDIGLIKITKTERIQDGVERIEFSAGEAAIEAAQRNDNILKESSDVFKVTPEQLPKTCDRFFNEWKSFKNEVNKLKGEIASLKTEGILNKTEKIGDLVVLSDIIDSDMNELIKMATDLTEKQGKVDVVVLGNSEGKIVGAVSKKALESGIKINGIIKDAAAILGGGGGGRPNLAQGAGPKAEKIQEALDLALEQVKSNL